MDGLFEGKATVWMAVSKDYCQWLNVQLETSKKSKVSKDHAETNNN